MNQVFIIGKTVTEVKFDFILNSKHVSISRFRVATICDKQEIDIIAYDEMADYAYANFKIKDIIMINGYLENNNVVLEEIKKVD